MGETVEFGTSIALRLASLLSICFVVSPFACVCLFSGVHKKLHNILSDRQSISALQIMQVLSPCSLFIFSFVFHVSGSVFSA